MHMLARVGLTVGCCAVRSSTKSCGRAMRAPTGTVLRAADPSSRTCCPALHLRPSACVCDGGRCRAFASTACSTSTQHSSQGRHAWIRPQLRSQASSALRGLATSAHAASAVEEQAAATTDELPEDAGEADVEDLDAYDGTYLENDAAEDTVASKGVVLGGHHWCEPCGLNRLVLAHRVY